MRRLVLFVCVCVVACTPDVRSAITAPAPSAPVVTPAFLAPNTVVPSPASILFASSVAATVSPTNPPELRGTLQAQVNAVLAHYPGDWHILVEKMGGEFLYTREYTQEIDAASVIKIPIALLFFKSLERQKLPSLKDYLADKGVDGRTYQQLLHAMLVYSEEDATVSLVHAVSGSHLDINKTLRGWGAAHTDVIVRKTTLGDLAVLVDGFYNHHLLTPPAREILLGYMSEYTPADDTRIGVIRRELPCGGQLYDKRGTITSQYLAVADLAIVTFPSAAGERAYLMAFFAYPGQKHGITYESLVQGIQALASIFWQDIRTENSLPQRAGCGSP